MSKAAVVVAKFHAFLQKAPACPAGDRILVRPFSPTSKIGAIHVPDVSQERQYAGHIVAMGDSACDKAFDEDHRIGDEIWHGKYAGVIEQWHRLTKPGSDPDCEHDSFWELVEVITNDGMELRRCRTCSAERITEPINAINIQDIVCNVSKQIRFERGEIRRIRAETPDKKTRYVIERVGDFVDTLEIKE